MDNSNNVYNVDDSYSTNNINTVNNQNNFNAPEKAKKPLPIIPIIIAVIFFAFSALVIRFFATIGAEPEQKLKTEADVVKYLSGKYRDDSFEVISKNGDKWNAKSTKSYISFEVYEDKRTSTGGLSKGEYVAKDDYVEKLHEKFISNYRGNSLTIKTDSSSDKNKYTLYKNGTPLTSTDMTSSIRDEIFRICDNMNNSYPFAAKSITWGAYYESEPDSGHYSFNNPFPPLTLRYVNNNGKEESLYCYPRTKSFEAMENTSLVK